MSQSCRWRVLRTPPPPSPLLAIKFRCVCERACPLLGGTNSNSKSSQTPPFLPGVPSCRCLWQVTRQSPSFNTRQVVRLIFVKLELSHNFLRKSFDRCTEMRAV